MKSILAVLALTLAAFTAQAATFGSVGGAPEGFGGFPPEVVEDSVSYVDDNGDFVNIVYVEKEVFVKVPEYVEVEVPVYLPSEEPSEAYWDTSSKCLYVYDAVVIDGPKATGDTFTYASLCYDESTGQLAIMDIEE